MRSLKLQLFTSLLALFVVVAAISMFVSYRQYASSVNAFMDGQMHGAALGYAQQITAAPKPALLKQSDTEHIQRRGNLVIQVWSSRGQLLAASYPIEALALSAGTGFQTVNAKGASWRVFTMSTPPFRLQIVQSADFRQRVILDSASKSVTAIAVLIPLSGLLLWLVIHWTLRPVDRLVQSIAGQDERTLATLPMTNVPQELGPLIESMNGLILRLRDAFDSQRRFVQDAAHELRTPLAACTLQAETLRQTVSGASVDALDRLQGGLQRMQQLVEQLLRLAHEDAEQVGGGDSLIDLRALIKECVADLAPIAEQRRVDLGVTVLEAQQTLANARGLRTILDNLIDNAVRYTVPGSRVDIAFREERDGWVIEVTDNGPGIPAGSLHRVFDRFYRVPATRGAGNGIGLAIVQSAARRNRIKVELINRDKAPGLIARVTMPRI